MPHALTAGLIALTVIAGTEVPAYESRFAQRVTTDAAVAQARQYLQRWRESLAAVVAEEVYTQTLKDFAHGARNTSTMRYLLSDVLLVRTPRDQAWLMFRDVMTVDGKPVHDRQRRFDALFADPKADLLVSARHIADEGARYNLGRIFRNINTPTTALAFLEPAYSTSVDWKDAKATELDGRAAIEVTFDQRRAPYVIRAADGTPQPASGRIWIAAGSGQILETVLEVRSLRNYTRSHTRIQSRFGAAPGLEPWVPVWMLENYEASGRFAEEMRGKATYSNHRTFQTGARIVGAIHDP